MWRSNMRPAGRIAASVSADLDRDGRRRGIRPGFYWRLRYNFRSPLTYGKPFLIAGLSMKLESLNERAASNLSGRHVSGRCLCGAVELEIDFPAFWAWHDHSAASCRAHGAAYATYRLLAQARPRGEGPKKHRSLRGCENGVDPKFLLPVRHAAALRAQAFAAHGQYPAGTLHRPYRPRASLSRGHRGASGLGLHRQPACPPYGLSRYRLGTPEIAPAPARR